MKKRIVWLAVSCLMALSLVLASCAPKVTEEKGVVTEKKVVTEEKKVVTEKEVVTKEKEGMVVDALGRLLPKPQYGGVLNFHRPALQYGFSNTGLLKSAAAQWSVKMTNEELLAKDRLKGPAGSGEWNGMSGLDPMVDHLTANLAESWEIIQPDTLRFKIRKGVYWQNKAPVYGSEMTAEDVVYSFLLYWTRPGTIFPGRYPFFSNMENIPESLYVDPGDPWTVVVKAKVGWLGMAWRNFTNQRYIVPKALGPIAGEGFGDWKGVVGTGPFILTDYVTGSSLTYQRNPNYWKKDPLYPENQLPYVDTVKVFFIADLATQQAALRTGKLDILQDIETEDAESLLSTNPKLLSAKYIVKNVDVIAMRNDVKPFDDVRVRQAMTMAINYDELVNDYYKGEAIKFHYPIRPLPEQASFYVPLEEMPEVVQQMYGYRPDLAKKLLDEAGYPGPNRFTTSILVSSAYEQNIDILSIVKAYWAKVGVTLEIDAKEDAVYRAMGTAFSYKYGIMAEISAGENQKPSALFWGANSNYARVNEPWVQKEYEAWFAAYFEPLAEQARIRRAVTPKMATSAFIIPLPLPLVYNLWQPWVQVYHGEFDPSDQGAVTQASQYVWIDSALRKSLGR